MYYYYCIIIIKLRFVGCRTVLLGAYKCQGPGAEVLKAVSWAPELDFNSAHPFLVKSFVNGRHWIALSDS
jgi:hypothetical protein